MTVIICIDDINYVQNFRKIPLTNLIVCIDYRYRFGNMHGIFLLYQHILNNTNKLIMNTRSLTKRIERMPSLFEDFFNKPLLDLFDGGLSSRMINVPAVNISERKDDYLVSLAAPGLKKEDFKIDMEGNMLTISSEKEETKEDKNKKFTRKEYSYSSFSRSFSVPEDIKQDKIEAKYEDGVLNISLPRKEEVKKNGTKKIAVK